MALLIGNFAAPLLLVLLSGPAPTEANSLLLGTGYSSYRYYCFGTYWDSISDITANGHLDFCFYTLAAAVLFFFTGWAAWIYGAYGPKDDEEENEDDYYKQGPPYKVPYGSGYEYTEATTTEEATETTTELETTTETVTTSTIQYYTPKRQKTFSEIVERLVKGVRKRLRNIVDDATGKNKIPVRYVGYGQAYDHGYSQAQQFSPYGYSNAPAHAVDRFDNYEERLPRGGGFNPYLMGLEGYRAAQNAFAHFQQPQI